MKAKSAVERKHAVWWMHQKQNMATLPESRRTFYETLQELEEATKKIQQEAARIESLSIQRQRYLDTLQQATKGKGLRQAHTQAQSFSLG